MGSPPGWSGGPKLDTASRVPLLLPEAVGAAGPWESLPREEQRAERAHSPGTMTDGAVVKEGWLHKRGECAGLAQGVWRLGHSLVGPLGGGG